MAGYTLRNGLSTSIFKMKVFRFNTAAAKIDGRFTSRASQCSRDLISRHVSLGKEICGIEEATEDS